MGYYVGCHMVLGGCCDALCWLMRAQLLLFEHEKSIPTGASSFLAHLSVFRAVLIQF